jgi:universal stress protein A
MQTIISHAYANSRPLSAYGRTDAPSSNRWNEMPPSSTSRTILVPLTLSRGSFATLAIAKDLAEKFDARLVLLHVVNLNIAGEERGIPRGRIFENLCQNAENQLHRLAGCAADRATVETLVGVGRPADVIVESARRLGADSIVLRRHIHHPWLNWLHQNTARRVVRQAPCRVWLVTPGKHPDTVNLTVVDRARLNQTTERVVSLVA